AQVGGEPTLGGQLGARSQPLPPAFGQNQLRELTSPLRGYGRRGPHHCQLTIHPAWCRLSHAAPVCLPAAALQSATNRTNNGRVVMSTEPFLNDLPIDQPMQPI